ncbi:jg25128 [Pararge aegeria aegeria]|uniref:Jg25128 protein n=1 Tax=Pararge aegeria aegeria TaxID=348720 RepID=A0A8S4SAN2_9NEOP|nr:jg25128 [Pararge aegeria aegeria]
MDVGVLTCWNGNPDPQRDGQMTSGESLGAARGHGLEARGTPYKRPLSSSGRQLVEIMTMTVSVDLKRRVKAYEFVIAPFRPEHSNAARHQKKASRYYFPGRALSQQALPHLNSTLFRRWLNLDVKLDEPEHNNDVWRQKN